MSDKFKQNTSALVDGELDTGATLHFESVPGDQALYVIDGVLDVDGRQCEAGGAMVLECGAHARLRATRACRVLHFGPDEPVAQATVTYSIPPDAR